VAAVGEASADAAQQHGFAAIAAGGTVTALVDFIQHHYAPANGSLLYASGEVISSDFTPYLQQEGFSLTRIALYRAHPATGLSHALQQVLIARQPLAALFYSERTARIFSRLVQQEGLEAGITHATAFTLSAPIASALKELPWNTIHVAAHPSQAALIELLSNRL
jgi:uroporphyrinogen-III synthase